MKIDKKDGLLFIISNSIILIYLILIVIFMKKYNIVLDYQNNTYLPVWLGLGIMFILELISTITFSLRIYFTGKNEFQKAGVIGAISGLIAGAQGILFISGNINFGTNLDIVYTFITKIPIITIATYLGIYLNLKYTQKLKDYKNGKKGN